MLNSWCVMNRKTIYYFSTKIVFSIWLRKNYWNVNLMSMFSNDQQLNHITTKMIFDNWIIRIQIIINCEFWTHDRRWKNASKISSSIIHIFFKKTKKKFQNRSIKHRTLKIYDWWWMSYDQVNQREFLKIHCSSNQNSLNDSIHVRRHVRHNHWKTSSIWRKSVFLKSFFWNKIYIQKKSHFLFKFNFKNFNNIIKIIDFVRDLKAIDIVKKRAIKKIKKMNKIFSKIMIARKNNARWNFENERNQSRISLSSFHARFIKILFFVFYKNVFNFMIDKKNTKKTKMLKNLKKNWIKRYV